MHRANGLLIRTGAVLLVLLMSVPASAEDAGAVLTGTVTDASGKTVPGAAISIRNVATGQATEVRADAAGNYTASNLTAGEYEFSVAAPGFSTAVTRASIASGRQALNLTLRGLLSVEELGFPLAQAQGSAADQALLDKRSHMLK